MKHSAWQRLIYLIGFLIVTQANAQIFWTETFDGTPCGLPGGSGCDPSIVMWSVTNTGANGSSANTWYVSATECGNAAGQCGTTCTNDASLHIGNVSSSAAAFLFCPTGDCGASYDASGSTEVTNKRAESPIINCTGQSGITINFNYIENGQGALDNAELWYFDGSTWSLLIDMPKTTVCGSGQGLWTAFSQAMPASANNNPNVRIGFRWYNNGDGSGSDPSFAVDDITLVSTVSGPPVAAFTATPNPTCVGQTVTVTFTGSALAGATYAWDFGAGATPATANTAGPHSVTYNTAGTSTISLTVTDANGTDNTSQTITINALPTVTANASPSLTICDGDQVTLTGSGATSYVWTGGVSNGVAFTPPLGSNSYTVTGTDANGCSNTANITVTVNSCATTVADFSAIPNPVCVGQTVTVTFTGSALAGTTYAWDFGAGATPATANTAGPHSVTYNTAGTSTISLTVTDANGTDNTSQTITINALPAVTASAAPSISVCDGDQVTLTGGGATSYVWTGGVSNGVAFTPPLGSNAYTVTGTDANGCSNTANITVTVNNCANPIAAFTASSTNICLGQTITFTDISTGTNISSWNWNFNGGTPGTANTQGPHAITFNTIGTHTISLSIIDDNGTDNTSLNITVNPLPTVTASASPTTICNGDAVTLTGSGANTYTWNGGVTNGVPFNPSASGTYTVTGTDANGCQNTASVSITVNNCLPPTAAFSFPNPICEGQCISFVDQSTDATSWSWTFAGAIPSTSNAPNPSNICFAAAGSYTISLEVSNSQGSDIFTQTIIVEAQPTLTVTPDVTIAVGSSTTLNATSGISGTYTWSPSTGLNGTTGPTVTASPESTTTYTVSFESTSGCTATGQVTVNVEMTEAFGIPSAFSPNNDGFNDVFRPRGSGVQNFTMQIFNRYGQLVFESNDFLIGWDGTMNGNKLNPGVFAYIITYNFYGKESQTLKGNVTLVE